MGEKNITDEFKVYQSQWEHLVLVSKTPACTFPYLAPLCMYINWVGGLGTPMNKAYLSINFSFGMIPNGPDFVCKNMKICLNKTSSKGCIGKHLFDMF